MREHWSKAQSWTLTADKRGAGPDGAHLGVFEPLEAPRVIRLLDPSGARHRLPATGVRPQPSPAAAAGIAGSQAALWSRAGLSPLTTSSSRPVRRLASWRGALPAAAAACSVGRDPHQKDPETVRGHSSTVRKASRRISKHWTVHILQLRSVHDLRELFTPSPAPAPCCPQLCVLCAVLCTVSVLCPVLCYALCYTASRPSLGCRPSCLSAAAVRSVGQHAEG
eukprot:COSAG01_NODE_963_length_12407_cov_38.330598_3_plen_223_part_00